MQRDIADAFIDILGDDGSALEREDIRISPAYLMRLHVIVVEIPEGSWGAGANPSIRSRSPSRSEATEAPKRLADALELNSLFTSSIASTGHHRRDTLPAPATKCARRATP